ncbi:hypothetical protein Tco_0465522 [Tanacetum coccineum]
MFRPILALPEGMKTSCVRDVSQKVLELFLCGGKGDSYASPTLKENMRGKNYTTLDFRTGANLVTFFGVLDYGILIMHESHNNLSIPSTRGRNRCSRLKEASSMVAPSEHEKLRISPPMQ